MKLAKAALVLLRFALSASGEPRFDASSQLAMQACAPKVAKSLVARKRAVFEAALKTAALSKLDMEAAMAGEKAPAQIAGDRMSRFGWNTASEVIEQAEVITAQSNSREKARALQEIAALKKEAAAADAAQSGIARFEMARSRFSVRDKQYAYSKEPVSELLVKNAGAHAISRAVSKGIIATPGRALPWLVEDFNYGTSGGIEPGETTDAVVSLNPFNHWGRVKVPAGAVFAVEVIQLEGPDGNTLFDSTGLTGYKRKRLAELQRQYPES